MINQVDAPTVNDLQRSNSYNTKALNTTREQNAPVSRKLSQIDIEKSKLDFVSYIKVEKHKPCRKNIHDKLIFWNEEFTTDYKYHKYLEQNRYNRLFKEIQMLGEGGFGKVYKVQHVLDQRMYAIKKIPIHLGLNQDFK